MNNQLMLGGLQFANRNSPLESSQNYEAYQAVISRELERERIQLLNGLRFSSVAILTAMALAIGGFGVYVLFNAPMTAEEAALLNKNAFVIGNSLIYKNSPAIFKSLSISLFMLAGTAVKGANDLFKSISRGGTSSDLAS